ncbi:amidohydrolase family protein [Acidobacteria bacterium AH-259-D05]|nr:amidohydrolase family protein [Acidobacteria bacterium AH-259-D05]
MSEGQRLVLLAVVLLLSAPTAKAAGLEADMVLYNGKIEPGRWADLVVIDRDYLTVAEDEIAQISPLLTVAGGKISYSEPKFASSLGLPTVGFQAPPDWWQRNQTGDFF